MSKKAVVVILLFLLLFVVIVGMLLPEDIINSQTEPRFDVTCNLKITNPIWSGLQIDGNSIDCRDRKSTLFSIVDWIDRIYRDKGYLTMEAQGEISQVTAWSPELSFKPHKITLRKLKQGNTVFKFKLFDTDGKQLDEETYNYYIGGG